MNHEERKGQNEVWFRELNEKLESRASKRPDAELSFEIVCECSRTECTDRIRISYRAYEAVRDNATLFILTPGHADATVEKVISRRDSYDVVQKMGDAALTALIDDPRS